MMGVIDTSLDAYQDLKPKLGEKQQRVLNMIKHMGTPTNREISEKFGIPINEVTPRVLELREMGKVGFSEKRTCTKSGRTANAWRAL